MRKSKILKLLLCTVIVLNCLSGTNSYAFERKDHDKYMIEVLFKNFFGT